MFVVFLIMLREGIEAALIVGIIASFLKQSGQSRFIPFVWLGTVAAAALCLALGLALYYTTGQLPQKKQELVEAIIAFIAVIMLTYMIFWMKKAAKSMEGHLQSSVNKALGEGANGWWLVGVAFLAVGREGLETVFFLLSVFQQSPNANMPVGAVLGLLLAIIVGYLIYRGGRVLNLKRFFNWTGIFLILVASGLLASAVRSLHEAGIWNHLQAYVFNWSGVLHEDSPLGTVFAGIFGYTDHPTQSDLLVWSVYLIIVLFLFFKSRKKA